MNPQMTLKMRIFTHCWWRHNRLAMTSQWPDNCDANTWQVISNSLDIDFIHGDIHGRSCKNIPLCISSPMPYIPSWFRLSMLMIQAPVPLIPKDNIDLLHAATVTLSGIHCCTICTSSQQLCNFVDPQIFRSDQHDSVWLIWHQELINSCWDLQEYIPMIMMTSSNGNIFRVTGPLCVEFTGDRWIPRTLQWRHNGDDSVSNHQPHDCLLNCLFRCRSKKTSKLRVTGLCVGNSPLAGEFPAQMASYAENVSIWWRHHDKGQWRGALMFSLICAWINCWVNNGEAGDLRGHRAHYDIIVLDYKKCSLFHHSDSLNKGPSIWKTFP